MSDPRGTGPSTSLESEPPTHTSSPARVTTSPTIYVHYGTRHVKARIDHEVPLEEIIRQLTASSQLQITEPSALFALRVKETGQLVTPTNLHSLLSLTTKSKNVFTLCSSPTIEAVETIDKLSSTLPTDLPQLKLATFSLKTLIKDPDFLQEFLKRDGLDVLEKVVERTGGNTLAYSLNVVRDLCTSRVVREGIWKEFSKGFVKRLVEIIATQPLINISRPATSILLYLTQQTSPSPSSPSSDDDDSESTPITGFSMIHPFLVSASSSSPSEEEEDDRARLSRFLPNLISHLPNPSSSTPSNSNSNSNKKLVPTAASVVGGTKTGTSLIDTESSESSLSLLQGLLRGFITIESTLSNFGRDRKEDNDDEEEERQREEEEEGRLMSLDQYREELRELGLFEIITSILHPLNLLATTTTTTTQRSPPPPLLFELSKKFLETYYDSIKVSYSLPLLDEDLRRELSSSSLLLGDGGEEGDGELLETRWRKMGWDSEDLLRETREYWGKSGTLADRGGGGGGGKGKGEGGREGFKSFVEWAKSREGGGEDHLRLLRENDQLPIERRIRFPYVSFEITRLISQYFNLLPTASSSSSSSPSITPTPLIFDLKGLHRVLMEFWIKIWGESGSKLDTPETGGVGRGGGDWDKVTELVKTQLEVTLKERDNKTFQEIESEFKKSDYRSIRLRQIEEFERKGDEIMFKGPVKKLRTRIHQECLEFVKEQRIDCLVRGIWVNSTPPPHTLTTTEQRFKFVRLAANTRKSFVVVEVRTREGLDQEVRERKGVDWMMGVGASEKIELSAITKITISTATSVPSPPAPEKQSTGPAKLHRRTPSNSATARLSSFVTSTSHRSSSIPPPVSVTPTTSTPSTTSSITLHFENTSHPPLTLYPPTTTARAELLDSLSFLLPHLSIPDTPTRETLEYIESLTEVGLIVKLLDLTGEGIEVLDNEDLYDEQDQVEGGGLGEGKRGMGLVRSVPSEEERFYYREFI